MTSGALRVSGRWRGSSGRLAQRVVTVGWRTTKLSRTSGAGVQINLFNPERIVLGGWAGVALGARLLPEIRTATAACALRHAYEQTSIELCQLGPDAIAVGAATLPVENMLRLGAGPRARQPLPVVTGSWPRSSPGAAGSPPRRCR